MRSAKSWDQKAGQLEYQMKWLYTSQRRNLSNERRQVELRRKVVVKQGQEIAVVFQSIRALLGKKNRVSARERSLLNWAGDYVEKLHLYYSERSRLMLALMWARLILVRGIGGAGRKATSLSRQGAFGIKNCHRQLGGANKALDDQLGQLTRQRNILDQRYSQLAIVKSNREAAASMQASFSSKFEGARGHPLLKGFNLLMKTVVGPRVSDTHR